MFQSKRTVPKSSQRGVSIMEIMVVLLIMGLIFGTAMPAFNALTSSHLRESSTQLAGTIRYLYSQAALQGLCMRLVIHLKQNRYHVEASQDDHCLLENTQTTAKEAKDKKEEEIKKQKEKQSTSSFSSTIASTPLELKKTQFIRVNSDLFRMRKLKGKIQFHGVYTIRQKEIYTAQKGPDEVYIHCFPLGQCERSVIFIREPDGDIYSLEIKPMTGRVVVHTKEIELQDQHKNKMKGDDDGL